MSEEDGLTSEERTEYLELLAWKSQRNAAREEEFRKELRLHELIAKHMSPCDLILRWMTLFILLSIPAIFICSVAFADSPTKELMQLSMLPLMVIVWVTIGCK